MKICENCTGCMSCLATCPHSAISVGQNEEGFYVPIIDELKCTNCELCKKTCPQNQITDEIENEKAEPVVYAAVGSNELAQKSSSGGLFSILSEYILEKNGYICGAAFSTDFKKAEHIIVDNIKDLAKLRTSKYLQSNVGNIYIKIKELLENNNYVLFSGTPCQVSGLKSYLKKDYEKLLTIDIVCHGTPSPKVWEKYLEKITEGKDVIYANFRHKVKNWTPVLRVECADGSSFNEDSLVNIYFKSFLNDLICNKACGVCKYTNLNRTGDFTLGDFWGVEKRSKQFESNNGVSLVLLNNEKSKKIFNEISKKISLYEERIIPEAISGNPVLVAPCDVYPYRKEFFEDLEKKPILENMKEKLNKKYNGIITNFWFGGNYGAVISAYAIQNYLKDCGFDFHILNYTRFTVASKIAKNFSINHLKLTHRIKTLKGLYELNNYSDNFVVGTDQVFRYPYIKNELPQYMLTYTDFNKKRIAFAASFGKDKFDEADVFTHYKVSKYLNRFDFISTREDSGINLCKKEFGIEAEHIIDPVFLLDKKYWINLINEADKNKSYKGKIVSYVLDSDETDEKIYSHLENKYQKQIVILKENTISVQEFLKAFYEADYIITDSFHGTCFSMIFDKKFVCIINKKRGGARFESIKNTFKIDANFIDSKAEILKKENIFKDFDKELFVEVINKEREKSKNKLNEILNTPKKIDNKKRLNEQIFNGLNFIDSRFKYTIQKLPEYLEEIELIKILFKYRNEKIAFWGASIFLERFLKKYKIKNKNIVAIIDKDTLKQGDKIQKYEIIAPEKIEEYNIKNIIFTIKNKHKKIYPMVKKYLELNNPNIKIEENFFKED